MMRVFDCFAGIGGFSLGLHQAGGYKTVGFCEIDKDAQVVLNKHFPGVPIWGDVRTLVGSKDTVDVFCFGSPCQDISKSKQDREGLQGERSSLFFDGVRLVKEFEPRYVIFENVTGLLSSNKGQDIKQVVESLSQCGYCVAGRVLDGRYFGIPQKRRRVFCLGSLGTASAIEILYSDTGEYLSPFSSEAPPQTVEPVAIQTYQTSGNGIGVSRVCRTVDTLNQEVVLAPLYDGGTRSDTGVPKRVDRVRQRLIGNAVPPPMVKWLGEQIMRYENAI